MNQSYYLKTRTTSVSTIPESQPPDTSFVSLSSAPPPESGLSSSSSSGQMSSSSSPALAASDSSLLSSTPRPIGSSSSGLASQRFHHAKSLSLSTPFSFYSSESLGPSSRLGLSLTSPAIDPNFNNNNNNNPSNPNPILGLAASNNPTTISTTTTSTANPTTMANSTSGFSSFAFPSTAHASSSSSPSLASSPPTVPLGVPTVSSSIGPSGHSRSQSHSSFISPNLNSFSSSSSLNPQFPSTPSSSSTAFNAFKPNRASMPVFSSSNLAPSSYYSSSDINAHSSGMSQNAQQNNAMKPSFGGYSSPPLDGIAESGGSLSQQATPVSSDFPSAARSQHQRTQSFLHVETTSDQFPILVRRESLSPFAGDSHQPFQNSTFTNSQPSQNVVQSQNQVQNASQQQQQYSFSQFQNHKKHQSFGGFALMPNLSSVSPPPPPSSSSSTSSSNPASSTTSLSGQLNLSQPSVQHDYTSELSRHHRQSQSFSVPHSSFTQPTRRSVHRSSLSLSTNNGQGPEAYIPSTSPVDLSQKSLPRVSSLTSTRDAYSNFPSLMETLGSVPQQQQQYQQQQKAQPLYNNNPSSSSSSSSDLYMVSNPSIVPSQNNFKDSSSSLNSLGTDNATSPLSPSSSSSTPRRNYNIARRHHGLDTPNKYADAKIEQYESKIYTLCKDQHGCRFLQKTLEDKDPSHLELIFRETAPHMCELMTDPFGNYLCQKLLEHSTSPQRTELVRNSAPNLIAIALDPHGTRALQKMIEYAKDPDQVEIIIEALRGDVVRLIKDLNGNHVIQKCLNHLQAPDTQFIIDAVSDNCVVVATHKHGCCVLQRCIDHSSPQQKQQLIDEIISHSHELVQDPFGNYVTQYVLDLKEPEFSDPLIRTFVGHVCMLSQQKFSSNVMEKCLRFAGLETQKILIEELIHSTELDTILRDPYANYVVQTALDYADDEMKKVVAACLIPILPSIKMTPYGRKIQAKLQQFGGCGAISPVGLQSPGLVPISSPTSLGPGMHQQQMGNPSIQQIRAISQVHQAMAAAAAAVSNMGFVGNAGPLVSPTSLPPGHSMNAMNMNGMVGNMDPISMASPSMLPSQAPNGMGQMNQMSQMNTMNQINQLAQMMNAMGVTQHPLNVVYNDMNTKNDVNNKNRPKNVRQNNNNNNRSSAEGFRNGVDENIGSFNDSGFSSGREENGGNGYAMDFRTAPNNQMYSGNDVNDFGNLKRNTSRNRGNNNMFYKNSRHGNNNPGNNGGGRNNNNNNNNNNSDNNMYSNSNPDTRSNGPPVGGGKDMLSQNQQQYVSPHQQQQQGHHHSYSSSSLGHANWNNNQNNTPHHHSKSYGGQPFPYNSMNSVPQGPHNQNQNR